MTSKPNPKCILLFSGKRKSGKDYLTEELLKSLKGTAESVVIKISAPIKSHFASTYNLNLSDLMSDGEYKEKFRCEMIKWSDEERLKDPGGFCSSAVKLYDAHKKAIWIVSDVRRKTDIAWFVAIYGDVVKTVRIHADEKTRLERGYVFTEGVDNVTSECDLDDFCGWDWEIDNSIGQNPVDGLKAVENFVASVLKI